MRLLVPTGAVFSLIVASSSAAQPADPIPTTVRVVAAGSAPFVLERDGRIGGLSVDIFRLVASEADIRHEIRRAPSVEAALAAVRAKEADIAVGPISITAARTASVAFTQPYYRAKTGIAAHAVGSNFWKRLKPFLTTAFLVGVGSLILILALVGILVWGLERRANPEMFPEKPLHGIGAGVWLALVTMTTVGYGDKAPITLGGRIVVGIWMVIAMITASSLTASIATALTLSQLDQSAIDGLSDLASRPVTFVRGTNSAAVARRVRARAVPAETVMDGIGKVTSGSVDAMIGDLPVLQYHLRDDPELPITLIAVDERVDNYGFAIPHDSPLLIPLDLALLHVIERGEVAQAERRWLTQ